MCLPLEEPALSGKSVSTHKRKAALCSRGSHGRGQNGAVPDHCEVSPLRGRDPCRLTRSGFADGDSVSRRRPPARAGPGPQAPPSMSCTQLSVADTHVAGVILLLQGKESISCRNHAGRGRHGGQRGEHICLDDKLRTKTQPGAFQEGPALLPRMERNVVPWL